MNLLHIIVESPVAGALGWALLHLLWEGAAIAAALAAVMVATRSPRARYAAACAAMLALAASFGVTLVRMLEPGSSGLAGGGAAVFGWWNAPPGAGASSSLGPGLAALVPWLAPLWLAGVWIFALRYAAGWISASRLRRRGVCCVPESWQRRLRRLRARLGVSRPVQLLESCLAEAPLVLGHLRPAILVPIGLLAGMPAAQVEAILLHELAHIRRCDYLVNMMQRVVECLFFYHPAAWWMSRVIRNERESCCDDVAVALGGDAHQYALALAALEERRGAAFEPAVAAKGGSLVKRIRRLIYPKRPKGALTPVLASLILVATAAVAMAVWPQARQGLAATERQARPAESSPYRKWLDGPVSYIINPREREAFENLTNDEERDMFIRQFWERRNPTPGSKTNSFKQEFDRRVKYADAHFGVDYPGWKSDRGHMYIIYGPPDEIQFHPNSTPYHFSVWKYRYLPGFGNDVVFVFADLTGNGDYRTATTPRK
jgi:GWxTD domain-containing protein